MLMKGERDEAEGRERKVRSTRARMSTHHPLPVDLLLLSRSAACLSHIIN
jgi:hypothetical protein